MAEFRNKLLLVCLSPDFCLVHALMKILITPHLQPFVIHVFAPRSPSSPAIVQSTMLSAISHIERVGFRLVPREISSWTYASSQHGGPGLAKLSGIRDPGGGGVVSNCPWHLVHHRSGLNFLYILSKIVSLIAETPPLENQEKSEYSYTEAVLR